MIIPAQGLRIVLAVRPVDFRCGHDALAGLVQNTLGLDPHSGLIVVFRSKRADRLKILLWPRGSLQIPPGVVSQIPPPARQDKGLLV
ncbi:transposase [Bradyrhizobium japonicum]